jgi:hypothetical protein
MTAPCAAGGKALIKGRIAGGCSLMPTWPPAFAYTTGI